MAQNISLWLPTTFNEILKTKLLGSCSNIKVSTLQGVLLVLEQQVQLALYTELKAVIKLFLLRTLL